MIKQLFSAIKISALAIALSLGLNYALAWTAPSTTPPGGNVGVPINTGTGTQGKMGSLGIGTTAPAGKLEVQGGRSYFTANSEPYAIGSRYSPAGGSVYFGATSASATPDAGIFNAGGGNIMTIQNGGNVGIGTTAPEGKLHIAGNPLSIGAILNDGNDRPGIGITGSYPQLVLMSQIANPNHGPTIMLGSKNSTDTSNKHWSIGTSGQDSTFLDIGYHGGGSINPHSGIRNYDGSTMMTFLNSGNVGIGTLAPGAKLDVAGTTAVDYLRVDPQNGANEGGELQLVGAGTYGSLQIDNYEGNARIHTLAAGKQFQVLGGDALINDVTVGRGGVNNLSNTAVGGVALASNTNYYNTAVGYRTLTRNTTGSYNTAVGSYSQGALSGAQNTTGNTSNGAWALSENYGNNNTANGTAALQYNTGSYNTANGSGALGVNTGSYNTADGYYALYSADGLPNGSDNTAIGYYSLWNNAGTGNTAVGSNSLYSNYSGSYNTGLGLWANVANGLSNATAVGYGAYVNDNNKVRLGNDSVYVVESTGSFSSVSDVRTKENIVDYTHGLDFITKLRPVSYNLKTDTEQKPHSGFIAQEVEAIGIPFYGINKPKTKDDFYSLNYAEFVVPLVNSVKELKTENDKLKADNEALLSRIEKIEAKLK